MTVAFTFPGQGSQHVGMGAELAKAYPPARAVFEEVDDALGESLSKLMWEGPENRLTLTENAQPALMATSLAAVRALEEKGFALDRRIAFVAGHSLGEYSALAAAGALTVADAAKLLRIRGRAMQEAAPVGQGAMAALLGAELAQAEALVAAASADGDPCQIANDNGAGQVVISGSKAGVDRAIRLAPEHGWRRAVLLPVSAPFHSALMQPAAEIMARALAEATVIAPSIPLVANVTAKPVADPDEIKRHLVEQVTGMVRWRETVMFLFENGVRTIYEVGAGRVLTGIARRIERELDARSIGTPEEVDAAAASLLGEQQGAA